MLINFYKCCVSLITFKSTQCNYSAIIFTILHDRNMRVWATTHSHNVPTLNGQGHSTLTVLGKAFILDFWYLDNDSQRWM